MLCRELLINLIPKYRTCPLTISCFLHHWLSVEYIFHTGFRAHASQFVIYLPSACPILPVVPVDSHQHTSYSQYIVYLPSRLETGGWKSWDRIPVLPDFRFPTMPPPWALTSLNRLRPAVPVRTLRRQTHAPQTRTLPRKYSTPSPEANSESNSRVFADPERPDLFYHLLEPPSTVSSTNYAFGLSFLDALRSKDGAQSPRIIGYLPASEGGHAVKAGLNDFRENRKSAADLG